MLIVLGGLPGTGKTTIAKTLASKHAATYLRIDEIEHALRPQLPPGQTMGSQGYRIAQALALSNLKLGNWVIADCVNPVPESRQAWREVARQAKTSLLEIELICSNTEEHRRRVESRTTDIAGFNVPDWAKVQAHEYTPWTEPRLILDTAILTVAEAIAKIELQIESCHRPDIRPGS